MQKHLVLVLPLILVFTAQSGAGEGPARKTPWFQTIPNLAYSLLEPPVLHGFTWAETAPLRSARKAALQASPDWCGPAVFETIGWEHALGGNVHWRLGFRVGLARRQPLQGALNLLGPATAPLQEEWNHPFEKKRLKEEPDNVEYAPVIAVKITCQF